MTAAWYPVPAIPSALVVMTRPPVVPSPAGPADMDHFTLLSSTGSMDCLSAIPSLPVVSTPEGGQSSRAAPWTIVNSRLVRRSDADGGAPGCPRLVLRGPF